MKKTHVAFVLMLHLLLVILPIRATNKVLVLNEIVMIGTSLTRQGDWNALLNRTDVVNEGVAGYLTQQILGTVDIVLHFSPTPKYCFIESGTNDVVNNVSTETIFQNQVQAINSMLAHQMIVVVQSTIFQNNNIAHNITIKEINLRLQTYCINNRIEYLDLNSVLSANDQLKPELTIDGTHLNPAGYSLWAVLVQNELSKSALPIELINFNAKIVNLSNVLTWQTVTEVNASHFDIERTMNGKNFEKIGKVLAFNNANPLNNYSFIDAQPIKGINYYRLEAFDLDGSSIFSKTVSVFSSDAMAGVLNIFPNPANDKITILNAHTSSFIIFDFLGRDILRGELSNKTELDISSFQIGYYFLNVGNESVKFFKE